MANLEENFPRGGTRKSHKSEKPSQQAVEQDNLFDISTEEESTKRKKSQKGPMKTKKLKTEKREAKKSVREKFEILSVESLCEGMRILGCVKEVNELELVISLPNGLQGFVQVTEICDVYTQKLNEQVAQEEPLEDLLRLPDLFSPGMLVRCVVSSLDITDRGKKTVKLSVNPKHVNKVLSAEALRPGMLLTGTVSSLEDHGYLVDIGVVGTRAFLSLQKAQEYIRQKNKGAKLKIGQYLTCLVEEVKSNGGIVSLSVEHSEISSAFATEEQSWNLNNLLPGLVVKAQVQKVTQFGLQLNFLTFFTGLVDFMHLEPKKIGAYSSAQTVKACILCIHPRTRVVRLSLRPIFLQPGRPLIRISCQKIGAVLDNVPVQGFFEKAGATFKLKDGTLAYARLSHLSDSKKLFSAESFKPGSTHKCRIIDYSQMDELVLLSLRKSVITAQFLRYHDIKSGTVIKGTVLAIKAFGILVKVGEQMRGLVPSMHLADIMMKNPDKKYHLGDEVKCRVLHCDPEAKKLIMTLKKTLVTSKLPAITCYEDAKPGLQTHGVIIRVKSYGCIVKFYNNVQGLVPKHELSDQHIPDPERVFYTGQVVKVAVLNCEPSKERMLLSFKLLSDSEPKNESVENSQKKGRAVNIGQLVDVKVLEKTKDGLEVAILPHNIPAFLPMPHLSDHVANGPLLHQWLQAGDTLHRVLCLSQGEKHILLCRKPALVSTVEGGQDPKSLSEIQPGMLLLGFVKSIKDYGVFVQFPSGLNGLAPKAIMSDKFVTTPSDHFVVGQTVVAKVTNVDEEKQRMLLSLRLSDCSLGNSANTSFILLCQYLEELQGVRSLMSNQDSVLIQTLAEMIPGMVLDVMVQKVLEDGSVVFSGGPVPDLILKASRYHRAGQEVESGQKRKVVVLHVDMLKLEVHVSLHQDLVNRKARKLRKSSRHQGIVQHLEESFAVASLMETGQLVAFSLTSHLNDTFHFDSEKLHVGQGVCLTLKTTEPGVTGLILAVEGPASKRTQSPAQRDSEMVDGKEEEEEDTDLTVRNKKKHGLAIGDKVTGTIKSVKATHVVVTLEDGIIGCIHASRILDDVPVGTSPTTTLKVGETVNARVIGGRDVKTSKFLPISHPRFVLTILELSIRPSDLKKDDYNALNTHSVSPMEKTLQYQAGQTVTCFFKKYNVIKKWLEVDVAPDIRGRIPLLLTSLSFKVLKHPDKKFQIGQALKATVVSSDIPKAFLCLSLIGPYKLEQGEIAMGQVLSVAPNKGLTISFPFGKIGKVNLFHVSDSYSEAPLEDFFPQKIVRCYVLSAEHSVLALSLRSSRANREAKSKIEDPEINSIQDVKEGQLLRGYVKIVLSDGVLVGLGPSVVGLAQYSHVSQCSPPKKELYDHYLPKGKLVTAKILRVNSEKSQVKLSLLPNDTGKPDVFSASPEPPLLNQKERKEGAEERALKREEKEQKSQKRKEKNQKGQEETEMFSQEKKEPQKSQRSRQGKREHQEPASEQERVSKRPKQSGAPEEDDSDVEVYYREGEDEMEQLGVLPRGKQAEPAEVPRLQLSSGFIWDVGLDSLTPALPLRGESSDSEEDEKPQQAKKKKGKKERELEKQKVEKELSRIEEALMDPGRQPESADDFDRLVLSSPDSSILWLQYMAFHLQATEIEKARAVAERALKTISFREEQEKLNVWVALLNLENMYGSQESLTKVFERAVQYNEPLKVFLHLADIYTKSEKFKEAGELYSRMLKRFRQEKAVWIKYGAFVLRRSQPGASHRVLQRALECLPTKEHVDVITKFAQLEFQLGDAERAKAIFENTLSTYPKRTDIWSVYIDMTIKHGSQKEVRDIFERVIHLSLAPKKMKFFFKRYLDYEKQHGTEKDVQAVKAKALEYVEAKSSALED